MGLDMYEVMLVIDEAFQLHLTDAEMSRCDTVGDIYQLLLSKTGNDVPPAVCLSRVAFFRLRGPLQRVSGLDRKSIRPRTQLADIFPREQLHSSWRRLADGIGVHLPALQKDGRLDELAGLAAFAVLICLLLGFTATLFSLPLGMVILALMPACALLSFGCILRQYFVVADRLPLGIATVGDLAHAIKWQYYAGTDQDEQPRSVAAQEIWNKLIAVLCDELGLKPNQLTLDANIVDLVEG
ncbi:MAG: hypothetical protein SGJ19_26550 [Planctomycetia bacterium]|nr:hypothetical protein [Planctomycetia bacterium]